MPVCNLTTGRNRVPVNNRHWIDRGPEQTGPWSQYGKCAQLYPLACLTTHTHTKEGIAEILQGVLVGHVA